MAKQMGESMVVVLANHTNRTLPTSQSLISHLVLTLVLTLAKVDVMNAAMLVTRLPT